MRKEKEREQGKGKKISNQDQDYVQLFKLVEVPNSSCLSDIVPSIIDFSSNTNHEIDFIQLFDLDFLLNNSSFDDSKTLENLADKIQEISQYDRSMLILDVDSLAGTSCSKSESSMGPSDSYSISNQKLFSFIVHSANSRSFISQSKQFWVTVCCRNGFLFDTIKKETSWP